MSKNGVLLLVGEKIQQCRQLHSRHCTNDWAGFLICQQPENSDPQEAHAVCHFQLNKLVNSVVHDLIKAQQKQQASALPKLHPRKLKTYPRTLWWCFSSYQTQTFFRHLRFPLTWLITCPALETMPQSPTLPLFVPPAQRDPTLPLGRDGAENSKKQTMTCHLALPRAHFLMW